VGEILPTLPNLKEKIMGRFKDLTGKEFGRLKVLEFLERRKKRTIWLCRCSCGEYIEIRADQITSGKAKSCGCLQKDTVTKHGFWNTDYSKGTMKFYKVWQSLRARCDNPNLGCYENYGGRGITYDPRWSDFLEFKKDMYLKYLYAVKQKKLKNASIERLDVNGNYNKENCTFIERTEQLKNKRDTHSFIAYSPDGEEIKAKNANEFAKKHGLSSSPIYRCLNGESEIYKGWRFKKITDKIEVNSDSQLNKQ
jgi:hypothetical protein